MLITMQIWSSTIMPHLRMPGLIAPNSYGAGFGYHPGGWGKSPVDEFFVLSSPFASLSTSRNNNARPGNQLVIGEMRMHVLCSALSTTSEDVSVAMLLMKCDFMQPIKVSCPGRTGFHAAGENENLQRAIRGRQIPKQGLHTLSMGGGSMKGLAIVQILRMTYIENDGKSNVSVCSQRWGKWILTVRVLSFSDTWVLFLFNFSYHGRVFYDAFFKYLTKPKLTTHGYLYHEGKQFEGYIEKEQKYKSVCSRRWEKRILSIRCILLARWCYSGKQLLWPDTKIDCLVSISCGSFTYKGLRFILHAIDLPEYFVYCRKEKGGWRYFDTGKC
ncbi:hypothetical protein COLO4_31307 [Corchorus olitorius]|uniref:Uncharacterized protein n=1 Tax=Corchorus olitorius TaxID=93759 RepID=A0A1R3H4V9_9ROSI|nr:hypothetical protein COLO4_31307 [Corchorus olitorius]